MLRVTKKELTVLYDALYDYGVWLFMVKYKNPCTLGIGTCPHPEYNYCCGTCKYISSKGCRSKCLGCKLWLCRHFKTEMPELEKDLNVARDVAAFFVIAYVQGTKKGIINSAVKRHRNHPKDRNHLNDKAIELLSELSNRDVRLQRLSRRVNELPRSRW